MVKAVRYDEFGGIDVLRVEEAERPVPGDGQVLVRVKAAGINPSEAVIRTGAVAGLFPSTFPSGQGSDLAGVVEQVGAGAGGFFPGDEVIGFTNERASQAELVLVEAGDLTRKPEKVSWEVAGGLFVAGAPRPAAWTPSSTPTATGTSSWPSPSASRPSGSTPSSISRPPRSTG